MKKFYFALCIVLLAYANQAFGSEAGMPQLNPEFWAAQIFWLTIIFSSLYIIIWKVFLPKITYSIENRKSKVVNDINESQKFKEKAEKKLQEYNDIISNSKKEGNKILEDAKKKIDKEIESKKKKFNDDIEKELAHVEKEVLNLKKSSLLNVTKIATETTSELIKNIINAEVNNSSVSGIVEDIAKKKIDKHL
jgi:F-type H+-transporting ATPase subunit b